MKTNEMFGAEYLASLESPVFGGRAAPLGWRLLMDDEAGYRPGLETWVPR